MTDDWIDTLGSIYLWGVAIALLMQLWGTTMYLFVTGERIQYQLNLNRVGLSWDPLHLRVYSVDEFKHTFFRFWRIIFFASLGCIFSWFSVAGRVYRIMQSRELQSMLTPEQKQAAFSLRTQDFTKDEVLEKLKILDPDLYKELGRNIPSSENPIINAAPDRFDF